MALIEAATGQYVHIEFEGVNYRTYFESNGSGIPLVCLHTSGADSVQYRHVLNDEELTKDFQVFAFDLPRHGKSLPPFGWWEEEYKLTAEFYMGFTIAFCQALELDRPVLMGCSMGGYLMLDMAYKHPDRFSAFVSLQPRAYAPQWNVGKDWLKHPEVNTMNFVRPFIRSLTSTDSPEEYRREVEWVYSKCAPGVLDGDFNFDMPENHDARPFLGEIDAEAVGLWVIAGDHDWSCYPEHTKELSDAVPGLKAQEIRMPHVGHFPPSENPAEFRKALVPVLHAIRDRHTG